MYRRQFRKTVFLECIHKINGSKILLDNDCSIRVYQSFVEIFSKIFRNMLALCLMLSVTYYAQNYAGIIGWSLHNSYIYGTKQMLY